MINSLSDLAFDGRRVFLRSDLNVPLKDGKVADDSRIQASLPTLKALLDGGAHVVLASHLGRPKGEVNPKYSLEPVGAYLAEMLDIEVKLTDKPVGDAARQVVSELKSGEIALLENLRFNRGEEANDEGFAKDLAKLCDVYVNDAFGAAHRKHASVYALAQLIPERAAGLLLEKELEALSKLRSNPEKPYVAVLGGAKVSDKIKVIEALLDKVDALIIGGAMANTFLAAQGKPMGKSLMETEKLAMARSVLSRAEEKGVKLMLPVDLVIADSIEASDARVVPVDAVPNDAMALDVGPQSMRNFSPVLLAAKTVFWNGPMGLFEKPAFSQGTMSMAKAIADCKGLTVVGGGDSLAAAKQSGLSEHFSHLSTGGGASLEFLEGCTLPGVQALEL
ncbi:MAG: phosphoglycerate kinase [Myxococcales bacterium]|nr:MAG: phosphoglycerate kinase [Myxococcales bacterium]